MRNKIFAMVLAFALSLVAVSAADVVYTFSDWKTGSPVSGVETLSVTCLDNSCSSVSTSPFSHSGNSGSASTLTISYPTTLQGTGYATYFFKSGYVPNEYKVTLSGTGTTNFNVPFAKVSNCNALVDSFSVTNDNFVNEPLTVSVSSSLDAATHSAFELSDNFVSYIPPAYVDEFYKADTTVTLTITNSIGNVVFTQSKTVSIEASKSEQVTFDWVPTAADSYTATISTQVTDSQCANSFSQSTSKQFTVLAARPTNQCYTLLNDLAVSPSYPKLGDVLTFTVNKISNEAGATAGSFTARPTTFTTTIRRGSSTVFSKTETVAATSTTSPAQYSLQFTPDSAANYTITVTGQASTCSFATNTAETETLSFQVTDPRFRVRFQIVDSANGNAVSGATVLMNRQTATSDSSGFATISNLAKGTYTFSITHPSYQTFTDSIAVNGDLDVLVSLTPRAAGDIDEFFRSANAVATAGTDLRENDALITVDVDTNDGSDAQVTVTADFYLNNVLVRSQSETYTADGNAVDNHQFTVLNLARGTYTIVYTLFDSAGNIEDILTQNNFVISDLTGQAQEGEQGRIRVDRIRFSSDWVMPGDDVLVYVTMENTGDIDFDDVKVKAVSLDMGTFSSARKFDLRENRERTATLLLNIPERTNFGVYTVRVIIEDDNGKISRAMHRDIRVGRMPRKSFITIIAGLFGL